MFNRKNEYRKHTCKFCGNNELNIYYGTKSYDDIPLYEFNFYELYKNRCARCGTEFYYLTRLKERKLRYMLKIKDDVDLKELRKYGLEKIEDYNIKDFKQIEMNGEDFGGWIEIRGFKKWREDYYSHCFELDELYDLITAGLVEKIEE